MFPFFILFSNRKPHPIAARSALSAKESVVAIGAGALAFGGLFLAFWLAASSILL